jgi:hypothetical protein
MANYAHPETLVSTDWAAQKPGKRLRKRLSNAPSSCWRARECRPSEGDEVGVRGLTAARILFARSG